MAPDVDVVVAVHDLRRDFARAVRSALGPTTAHGAGLPTTASGTHPPTTASGTSSRTTSPEPRAAGPRSLGPRGGAPAPRVRVTAVAHNLDAAVVVGRLEAEGLGDELAAGTVRVLELADGVPSPSGPFTLGLERAEARYVSIMGSDDHLEPGALAAWFDVAESRGSVAVLAPMRLDGAPRGGGRLIRNPVPRPFAGRLWAAPLDPVRDRLASRSAPLGLLRRDVVDRLGLRLVPGLRTGEDIPFSARLWFSGERIDLDRSAPAYVIGTDAAERVSVGPKPVEVELAAVRLLRDEAWVEALGGSARRALAVTMLRVHVLGAVTRRVARGEWDGRGGGGQAEASPDGEMSGRGGRDAVVGADQREGAPDIVVGSADQRQGEPDAVVGEVRWLGELARDWVALSPAALDPLSRADRLVLDGLLGATDVDGADPDGADADGADADGAVVDGVVAAARARAAAGRVATIVPARVRHVMDREGTLRRYVRERMWW